MTNNILRSIFLLVALSSLATAIGAQRPSNLGATLKSLGYTVQTSVVQPTDEEKNGFGLLSKRTYWLKSIRPVRGEQNLFYRFTVDVETYPHDVAAQQRLAQIEATPPGVDSKLEPPYSYHEGFRRGNIVYVVSTGVYKFVIEKALSGLRQKLDDRIVNAGDHGGLVRCGPKNLVKVARGCKSAVDPKKKLGYVPSF